MNPEISKFLQSRIDAGDFPSAVYLVAEKGEIVWQDALGHAVVEPEKIEAKLDTIYDVASLTKPLVIGLLCAKLFSEHELEAGFGIPLDPAGKSDEFFFGASMIDPLTHRTHLPAWKPFYLLVKDREEILREILRITFEEFDPSGPEVVYSDLNFMILTFLIERVQNERIDGVAEREIFRPLGLNDTFYNPGPDLRPRIAASEHGNDYEKQICAEQGYDWSASPFRDYQIWGEVHDGNAWFMGGVAGHAGLFSTAQDIFRIALQFLPGYTQLLKPETCRLFRTNYTKGMNEDRSFSFQLASTEGSTAGRLMSPESYGHNGFTGTSLWIDPVAERIFVLLTNRTHAHALPFTNINSVRREFHDLAVRFLDKKKSN